MAVHTTIPNSNVLLADVRDTLNANGGSVSNDLTTFFTTAAKINPWSKKKPVENGTYQFCQDFDSTKPNYVSGWWKGTGRCGFTIPTHSTYMAAVNATTGGMNGWTYNLPIIYKRLGDFIGYYPAAKPMMRDFSVPENVAKSENKVQGSAFLHTDSSNTELTFADFPDLASCYMGMYITNGTTSYRATATTTIGAGGSIVAINSPSLTTGAWTATPFLSSKAITQGGSDPTSAMYYTIPNLNKVSFNVVDSMIVITMTATKGVESVDGVMQFGTRVKVTVKSNYTGSVTLSTNKILIKASSKGINDYDVNQQTVTLSDVTIAGGGTATVYDGFIVITNLTLYNDFKVWVSLDNGDFTQGVIPMTQSGGGIIA